MPAAGTTIIPKQKKAKILAEKRVRTGTTAQIAKRYGVAEQTVKNLAHNPPEEILPLAAKFEKELAAIAAEGAKYGLSELRDRMKAPKKQSTKDVATVSKLLYDVHRLQTNQPTTINQNQKPPIEYALEFARTLLAEQPPEIAREIFRRAKTVQVGIRATDEDWIEAEARVFQ